MTIQLSIYKCLYTIDYIHNQMTIQLTIYIRTYITSHGLYFTSYCPGMPVFTQPPIAYISHLDNLPLVFYLHVTLIFHPFERVKQKKKMAASSPTVANGSMLRRYHFHHVLPHPFEKRLDRDIRSSGNKANVSNYIFKYVNTFYLNSCVNI